MAALGVVGVSKISAKLQGARDAMVTFQVVSPTRRSMDEVELGRELNGRTLRTDNALYRPDRRFFVSTAVAFARGLSLAFEKGNKLSPELAIEVANLASVGAGVTVDTRQAGQVTFVGEQPVAFGVAVVQVSLENGQLRMDFPQTLQPVRRTTGRERVSRAVNRVPPPAVKHELLGGPHANLLIDVSDDGLAKAG
jgi:hypothetical protein